MSRLLVPALIGRDRWNTGDFSPHLFDQHFCLALTEDDLSPPAFFRGHHFIRPLHQTKCKKLCSGLSEVVNSKDKFQAVVDVSHFNPEDITVKVVDNCVVIDAKHEEKMDQHGFISRQFSRRYVLPEDVNPEDVVSSLTSDGVLTIEAPKKMEQLPSNERMVPVTMKEAPSSLTKEQMDAKQ